MSEVDSQPNRMVRYLSAAGIVGLLLYTGTWHDHSLWPSP
jgi:hypothetical protein